MPLCVRGRGPSAELKALFSVHLTRDSLHQGGLTGKNHCTQAKKSKRKSETIKLKQSYRKISKVSKSIILLWLIWFHFYQVFEPIRSYGTLKSSDLVQYRPYDCEKHRKVGNTKILLKKTEPPSASTKSSTRMRSLKTLRPAENVYSPLQPRLACLPTQQAPADVCRHCIALLHQFVLPSDACHIHHCNA